MHLAVKFHHPMFDRSEVIVLTNKQTPLKHPPSFDMLSRWVIIEHNKWS